MKSHGERTARACPLPNSGSRKAIATEGVASPLSPSLLSKTKRSSVESESADVCVCVCDCGVSLLPMRWGLSHGTGWLRWSELTRLEVARVGSIVEERQGDLS